MYNQSGKTDFHYYQSANADADTIRENFLVRIHEYEVIIDDIRKNPMKGSVQHYLLLGRRGSGKSTLLKRVEIEICSDPELSKTYVAINLAEEQANIYRLFDLLSEIIVELEHNDLMVEQPEWEDNTFDYSRALFDAIHSALAKSQKKLVLLLDNIDRIFENLQDDASLLREYLLNYDDIKIIGGSTRMTEHFWKYNKPFYEFFRILELKPLTSEEIRCLLLNWSKKMDLPALKEFVENKPGQLEMVRLLTDGLPRTLLFFVNILITRTQETGFEYLRLIMDSMTPLYQERLNNLPSSQRKIVLQMAFLWESVGAKDIGEATCMENKLISAQLNQLIEKGIAEKVSTSTKNNLYRLSERFFNLWLIFTQGSPAEKKKARCLTVFMENFYDEKEMIQLASQHLNELDKGELTPNKAALLTKALAQSRFISTDLRDALIDKTMEIKNITSDLKIQLPPTSIKVFQEVAVLSSKKEFKKAFRCVENIEQEDGFRELLLGYIYKYSGDFVLAEKHYFKSIEKGMIFTTLLLAKLYRGQKKHDLAIKYFEEAKEKGVPVNSFDLGVAYLEVNNIELAEKYFEDSAVENPGNILTIIMIYARKRNLELATKYLLKGVESKEAETTLTLAIFNYLANGEKKLSIDLIKQAEEFGNSKPSSLLGAKILIGLWCGNLEDIEDKIEELFEMGKWDILEHIIWNLVVHFQTNLAYKLFTSSSFAEALKVNLKPLHYVVCYFARKDGDIELKIPPEIKETFDDIIKRIEFFRLNFYPSAL